jgi:hypothetical protein
MRSLLFLLFFLPLANAKEQPNPLRAGIDVPQPTILKSVPISYPQGGRDESHIILTVLIDEQGAVGAITDAKEHTYESEFLEAAKSAVKNWRFNPTFVKGKAVPVIAAIAILFSTRGTPAILTWDEGSVILMRLPRRADLCRFPIHLDRNGNLNDVFGDDVIMLRASNGVEETRKEYCGSDTAFFLCPESDVPFALIEKKMQEPGAFASLDSPKYRFLNSAQPELRRLYYSTMLTGNESQHIQLAGVDPDVKPPRFKEDLSHIAASLGVSPNKRVVFFYTVFVDENGRILEVESREGNNGAIKSELNKATVISPGTLGGKPVPTAVIVAVPAE